MLMFFCSVCIDDKQSHPDEMDMHDAFANCPDCGSRMQTSYARPENATESQLTLEEYNRINGLDNI
jgi:DNA-directed RNA polymerase subunit RPC12/RpoP